MAIRALAPPIQKVALTIFRLIKLFSRKEEAYNDVMLYLQTNFKDKVFLSLLMQFYRLFRQKTNLIQICHMHGWILQLRGRRKLVERGPEQVVEGPLLAHIIFVLF